ncbi:MAG: zinc ribbon domain-containing protein [Planctomycetota bacterium]
MFCGECGAQNPDTGKFCTGCGTQLGGSGRLPQAGQAATSVVPIACANCGASVEVPEAATTVACDYCGTNLTIERSGGQVHSAIKSDLDEIKAGIAEIRRGSGRVAKTNERTAEAHERLADEMAIKRLQSEVDRIRKRIGLASGRVTDMLDEAKAAHAAYVSALGLSLEQHLAQEKGNRQLTHGLLVASVICFFMGCVVPAPFLGLGILLLVASCWFWIVLSGTRGRLGEIKSLIDRSVGGEVPKEVVAKLEGAGDLHATLRRAVSLEEEIRQLQVKLGTSPHIDPVLFTVKGRQTAPPQRLGVPYVLRPVVARGAGPLAGREQAPSSQAAASPQPASPPAAASSRANAPSPLLRFLGATPASPTAAAGKRPANPGCIDPWVLSLFLPTEVHRFLGLGGPATPKPAQDSGGGACLILLLLSACFCCLPRLTEHTRDPVGGPGRGAARAPTPPASPASVGSAQVAQRTSAGPSPSAPAPARPLRVAGARLECRSPTSEHLVEIKFDASGSPNAVTLRVPSSADQPAAITKQEVTKDDANGVKLLVVYVIRDGSDSRVSRMSGQLDLLTGRFAGTLAVSTVKDGRPGTPETVDVMGELRRP